MILSTIIGLKVFALIIGILIIALSLFCLYNAIKYDDGVLSICGGFIAVIGILLIYFAIWV